MARFGCIQPVSLALLGIVAAITAWKGAGVAIHVLRGHVTLASAASPVLSPIPPNVYQCHPAANELLQRLFPQDVIPSGISKALVDPLSLREWRTLEDTYGKLQEQFELADNAAHTVRLDGMPIETYWLTLIEWPQASMNFLQRHMEEVERIAEALDRDHLTFHTTIEKALLQRDVLQIYCVVSNATAVANSSERARLESVPARSLARLVRKLLLSENELAALCEEYGQVRSLARCHTPGRYTATDEYLPGCLVESVAGWLHMRSSMNSHQHFSHYRGRSFFHVYIHVPDMAPEDFRRYWHYIAHRYGANLNTEPSVPPLPAGTETAMVRTAGVLLDDWTLVDSGIVEEVLVRAFLTDRPSFAPTSSDYRGTVHWQYVMDRSDLLNGCSQTLGLRRIRDDDPAFVGLFPGSPDLGNALGPQMTTARFNCIACHSEALYGSSTVFSLGFPEVASWPEMYKDNEVVEPTGRARRLRLKTKEFLALRALIGGDDQ